MLMPVRGPPTLWRVAPPFSPPRRWVFPLFFSFLTQPHLHPLRALHVPDPPRQNSSSHQRSPSHLQHLWSVDPMRSAKHFSQTHHLQYPIHPRPISLLSLKIVATAEDRSCWPNLHLFPGLSLFPQSLTFSSSLSLSLIEFSLWMNGANGFLFC